LVFDGRDDYVEIKDPFKNNTTFTISLWVKPSALNDGTWHGILGKRWGELCSKPGLWVAPDKSGLHYDSYGQQGNGQYSGILNNFFSAKDSWVHITWVKEGTQYRFYRNGKLFETKPAPETFYTAKTSYWLGRVDYFFAGAMTEVSIWSVARTEADIQKDMHQHLKGDEPGLSYYWAFNEGNGNTVHERVTRPKDGVIRGATWQQAELPLPIPAHTPRAIAPVLAFDGVDDSVEVQDPFQNNTTFSICLWVKPSVKDDGARHGILGKTGDENLKPSLWVAEYDSALQYDSYTPAGKNRYSQVLSNFFTALDQWVHIAWVKQGSEYRFYRNGELFATKPAPATFYTAATSYLIGRVDNFFAGQMTEVSVWSVARTQEDIQKDMHRRLKGDEAGLAYYWAFNEGSGNTAHDKAKNAKHGTINGATWQEAAVPVASPEPAAATSKPKVLQPLLAFDGKDDFVELPALSLPSGNEITVSFWAYVDDLFYGDATVISGVDSANRLGLTITAPINSREISFLDGGDGISQPILFTEYRGKWSHWALTKNATAGEMKIYRNGELFHSATGKTVPLAPMAKVVLGKRPDHNMSYYQGKLKDVSIWSRARSQEEIKADMNRPLVGNEAGLVGYWPLNEGTGTVVNDRTSNANHGTIQGATWQQAEGPGASPQPAFAKVLQPVLAFDGVDDYVETPDPFDSTTNFTISLWNYRIHPAMSSGAIMGKSGGGEKYLKPTVLSFGATRLVYNLCSSDGKASTKLVEGFFADQEPWLHITWVKEGKEVRIYRNGELFGTYSAPDNFYTSSKTCYWLGRWGGTTGGNLLGYITDVNIWSVARTQADIQKDMRRRLQGDEPGLCYYLPLNEASGTTAFDLANRPNHGKIIGATWQQSEVPIASPPAEQKVP
jgi:ribosomal protein L39E